MPELITLSPVPAQGEPKSDEVTVWLLEKENWTTSPTLAVIVEGLKTFPPDPTATWTVAAYAVVARARTEMI